jgi:hypothetical protein
MNYKNQQSTAIWIPIVLGVLFFLSVGGVSVLDPSNVSWLMRGFFDPPSHQMAWEFFRETPWLQFPIGKNLNYGMEQGSSIVFSDSLPLFALPFKLFSSVLGDNFQYFGWWILLCMVMQAVFSYLLLLKATRNTVILLVGTCILLLLPAYLMRFSIHIALGGHWLLMGGLYLYFCPTYRAKTWLALLLIATGVHAYLLLMLAAIWGADLVQRLLARQLSLFKCFIHGALGSLLTLMMMWLLGYFMLGASPVADGVYGRMNLLSLLDFGSIKELYWSKIFTERLYAFDWLEGDAFGYIGGGIIALLLLSLVLVSLKHTALHFKTATVVPILLMAVFMYAIATTGYVRFGEHELFKLAVPAWLDQFYFTFRSPGRLYWPALYLLCLAAVAAPILLLKPKVAVLVLSAALALQVYDLSGALQNLRQYMRQDNDWRSPLTSPLWSSLGEHYKKVIYIRPQNIPEHFLELTDFAVRHDLAINAGNFARINLQLEQDTRAALAKQVAEGSYDREAIYVLNDAALFDQAVQNLNSRDAILRLDNIAILLPDYRSCTACAIAEEDLVRLGTWPGKILPTVVGQIDGSTMSAARDSQGYLTFGPYTAVEAGDYHYRITYSAEAARGLKVASWDITNSETQPAAVLNQGDLFGTDGQREVLEIKFNHARAYEKIEARTFTLGVAPIRIYQLEILPAQTR